MNKFVIALVIGLGVLIAACGPAPILPSAPIPTLPPLPSLVPPATITPVATVAPSATATTAVTASPTVSAASAITQTLIARTTVTATTGLTNTRPAATTGPTVTLAPTSAAAGAPPGVYVLDVRVDPNPPTRTADLTFYPTFANNFATVQNYRWLIYVYKGDNPTRSTTDTTPVQAGIPVGQSEQKAGSTWKPGAGQCEVFIVRVAWLDQDKRATFFPKPDGKVFEKSLYLC